MHILHVIVYMYMFVCTRASFVLFKEWATATGAIQRIANQFLVALCHGL